MEMWINICHSLMIVFGLFSVTHLYCSIRCPWDTRYTKAVTINSSIVIILGIIAIILSKM